MRSVRISWKTAETIIDHLETWEMGPELTRAFADLRAAMKPKRSVKLARARKSAKRATKKERTQSVRAAVMKRAAGACEVCSAAETNYAPLECDHVFGRARSESLETCWALCRRCHRMKTDNTPSAAAWLSSFILHARPLGYASAVTTARRRLESLSLSQQSEEVGR